MIRKNGRVSFGPSQDNLDRFTMLCLAAMEAPLILDINGQGKYGDKVIFLANDWQAGLAPHL